MACATYPATCQPVAGTAATVWASNLSHLQVESSSIKNDTLHSFQALYPALAAAATTTAAAATSITRAATRTLPTQTLAPRAAPSPTSPTSTPKRPSTVQYCDIFKILRQALQRGGVWLRRRRLRLRKFEPGRCGENRVLFCSCVVWLGWCVFVAFCCSGMLL